MRTVALLLLIPTIATAQLPKDAPKSAPGLPRNAHAVALALADSQTLPPEDRPFVRYLWIPNADVELAQALGHGVNMLSRTGQIHRPVAMGRGKLLMLRIDARWYASRAKDLAEWLTAWEELRFDPEFSLLLTKDTLRFAQGGEWERRYMDNGKVRVQKVTAAEAKAEVVLRVVPPDLDAEALLELQTALVTTAPVVRADYFVARALASIRDAKLNDGLYDAIYGGLYDRFVGSPPTLDEFFEKVGVGNVRAKVTRQDLFDRLRSDRRVAIFRSRVAAGRPRLAEFFPHLAGNVYSGERFVSVTSDLRRSNFDIGVHPLLNLFKTLREPDAHETIFDLPNGLHGYRLDDGAGKLQEKAPDDVVSDHTVPAPFYRELQAPISCISCHEAQGGGGWLPIANDAAKLLSRSGGKLAVPFDLNFADQADAVDRIATLFSGAPDKLLQKGRDSYARAVLEATGPWAKSKKNQTEVVQFSSGKLVETWRDYFYGDVDARRALLEIGWDVPAKDAAGVLDRLTPAVPGTLEDPRIGALKAGITIGRYDFDLTRRSLAARVQATIKANPKLLESTK